MTLTEVMLQGWATPPSQINLRDDTDAASAVDDEDFILLSVFFGLFLFCFLETSIQILYSNFYSAVR